MSIQAGNKEDAERVGQNLAENTNECPNCERLREALDAILPMAKGYAVEHPVGNNIEIVKWADALQEEVKG